jgi:hypothetical protein
MEDSIRICEIDSTPVGCEFPNEAGELVFFEDGEPFGDLIPGVCEPTSEWSSVCKAPARRKLWQL